MAHRNSAEKNIVLVHGAWADGSSWSGVIERLPKDGYKSACQSEDDFHFAADVNPVKANVMYVVQQALSAHAFNEVVGVPAWKSLPSWCMAATNDQAIPLDAERMFMKPTLMKWRSSSRKLPKPHQSPNWRLGRSCAHR